MLDARAQVERQKLTHSAEGVDALDDVRKVDARAREIRRCAKCGDPGVRVEHVTFHFGQRGWSLPRGRTYRHRCSACGVSFHTESALRMACAGGLGLFLLAIWSKIGAGHYTHWVSLLTFFAGASMVGFTAWRVVARLRNPLVPT